MSPDAIVVGSGFGGAFAAERLVDAGLRVTVVERGPWRDTAPTRAAGVTPRSPLPRGRAVATHLLRRVTGPLLPAAGVRGHADGLFDVHLGTGLTVVSSSGVGGGSHVYSAMNTRPSSLRYWAEHADGVDDATMAPHYEHALARMGARPVAAGDGVPNATVDRLAADGLLRAPDDLEQPAMGYRFDAGSHRSNSFLGSADGAKVTLDELLLVPAVGRGLEVLDRHEVVDLGRSRTGWRVTVRSASGRHRHLAAPVVVLAAGTLNTLRLLLAARARGTVGALPALGTRVGGNGDVISWWPCDHGEADYSLGTPCHGRFTADGADEELFLASFGLNGIDDVPLPRPVRDRLRRDLLLVGMGCDAATGVATWHRGRLRLQYDVAANPVLDRISDVFARIGRASGRPVRLLRGHAVTVHPFGGARTGEDPARAVVDPAGQVHGEPGLFIADGSALPAAPGTPPSMSIAAWALHVADQLAPRPRRPHVHSRRTAVPQAHLQLS